MHNHTHWPSLDLLCCNCRAGLVTGRQQTSLRMMDKWHLRGNYTRPVEAKQCTERAQRRGEAPATAACLVPSLSNSSPFTAQPLCVPAPLHAAKAFTTPSSSVTSCWGAFYSQALYVCEKGRGPCLHFKDTVKDTGA